MSIKEIFPIKVLIKDLDLADYQNQEIKSVTQAIMAQHQANTGVPLAELTDNEIPLFTPENLEAFPILQEVRQIFIDGFVELAQSFTNNVLTKEQIEEQVTNNTGKLPIMKRGDYKELHNHVGASAFGILYLDFVDNDTDGGKLILRDPAMHSNVGFSEGQKFEIETRKNRLIIAPAYLWHEVTPYMGEERCTLVFNLDLVDPANFQNMYVPSSDFCS